VSPAQGSYRQLRDRAEALLEQSADLEEALSHRTVHALVHDLSVHQIELELQNEELQLAQAEMQKARDEYLKLYNHAPNGYLSLDHQGTILRHNQTFAAMAGDPDLTAVGVPLGEFLFPEDRSVFLARYKAFFKSPGDKHIEVRLRRPGGSLQWVRLSGRRDSYLPIYGAAKDMLLLTLSDIDREKLAQDELLQTRDAAQAANREKSQFLSNMSHEIRTPMNGILGLVQLIGMTPLTPQQREYLDLLAISGKNMLTLINSILDLSKIEAGMIALEAIEFELAEAFRSQISAQSATATLKRLAVTLDLAPDLPRLVSGDQLRLDQIVSNLLSNALKFTENGGVTIRVSLAERAGTTAVIAVELTDTGIGIAPEGRERLFAPFVQADMTTTRKYGGTGLGLAICRKLLELMGGTIELESEPGEGTTFRLRIPLEVASGADPKPGPRSQERAGSAGLPGPLDILIAEDNQINQRLLSGLLEMLGHRVQIAGNGTEAVEFWRRGPVDCVFMDIQMPVMGGDDATRMIRREEAETGGHTSILAVTAFAMKEDCRRFMDAGFDSYLTKPISIDELQEELRKVMETRAALTPRSPVRQNLRSAPRTSLES